MIVQFIHFSLHINTVLKTKYIHKKTNFLQYNNFKNKFFYYSDI